MAASKTARKKPAAAKRGVKKSANRGAKNGAQKGAQGGVSTAAKTSPRKPVKKTVPQRGARKASRKPARVAAKPAAQRANKAPAKPAPRRRPHPAVVHWEIQSSNPARQRDFFSNLFGWSIDANNPQDYGMVPHGGADSIGGGIGGTQDATSRVTVYVEVPDVDAVLARAEQLGAATVLPRTDMGMVVMAQFRDLEGNLIGLVEGEVG
jgi:predicted enzyme related to lactoylglutathione lyase